MLRIILIVAAVALVAAGVAASLSQADVSDPGQPIVLQMPSTLVFEHDGDPDRGKAEDRDKKADKTAESHDADDDDHFAVTDSQPVVARDHDDDGEDDWDDDGEDRDYDDGYEDQDPR